MRLRDRGKKLVSPPRNQLASKLRGCQVRVRRAGAAASPSTGRRCRLGLCLGAVHRATSAARASATSCLPSSGLRFLTTSGGARPSTRSRRSSGAPTSAPRTSSRATACVASRVTSRSQWSTWTSARSATCCADTGHCRRRPSGRCWTRPSPPCTTCTRRSMRCTGTSSPRTCYSPRAASASSPILAASRSCKTRLASAAPLWVPSRT
mmetsp:Transcript_39308/g.117355  ORF Transcript_39308/g.117355 Transcript_39308/m.117355 type:complete len:208 (+) Transcript_39308:216-839(+)